MTTPLELVCQHYTFPPKIVPHPLQVETINDLATLPNSGEWLDMGCVDSETEYLSPTGWKRIADYTAGKVAQFVRGAGADGQMGAAEFVEPLAFIKSPCDEMVVFRTTRGVDQKLSLDHRVPYVSATGRFKESIAEDVLSTHERNKMGWKGWFITTFSPPAAAGLPLTDADIRLTVAVIADGHFPGGRNLCTIRVKKPRKIQRLRRLLADSGVEYKEKVEPWKGCEGFVRFRFRAPLHTKVFGDDFYSANLGQLKVIVDELPHWDGSVSEDPCRGFRFFSSVKRSADFAQYALCAVGIRSTIAHTHRVREGRPDSDEYYVQTFTRSNLAYLCGCVPLDGGGFEKTPTTWKEASTDGFQYCFTVPSSYLILRRNGCVFVTGNCGKTFVATTIALFHKITLGHRTLIVMPPLLIWQWGRWLRSIAPALTVTEYRGTPAQRAKLDLDVDFVLVGIQIFKRDYAKFVAFYSGKPTTVIVDEATMVGGIESAQHDMLYEFVIGRYQIMLTGTPMNSPLDAYGLMKFSAPGEYRNYKQFADLHVDQKDFYGRAISFKNLPLLKQKLVTNSKRILFEDMYKDTEPPLFVPEHYDLDPEHYKLYRKLAEEELLKLPDGSKIDATQANRLIHALGQIIVNWPHFSGEPKHESSAIGMIKQKLGELGDGKLVVFANYKLTVAHLKERLQEYGVVTINSLVSEKQKDRNVQQFVDDPACRVVVAQFVSAGKGLDGLQHACNHGYFVEPCQQPRDFHQCVGRLKRLGQRKRVWIGMGIVNKTTQVRGFKNLLHNDAVVNQAIRNAADLRKIIYGD